MNGPFTVSMELIVAAGLSIYLGYDLYMGDAPLWVLLADTAGIVVFLIPALLKWKQGDRRRIDRR